MSITYKTQRCAALLFKAVAILVNVLSVASINADQTVSLIATQDSMVREQDPSSNFGGAGALCVAGSNSVNGSGQSRGRFDSVLRFNASSAINAFNTTYGAGNWVITNVILHIDEQGSPENLLFPRGVGEFRVSWLSNDAWTEGGGTPNSPASASGDMISWDYLQTMIATSVETDLGAFSNNGVDGIIEYSLALAGPFISDLGSGALVTFHVAPQSPTIGFTFHSRNFSDPDLRPQLLVTATQTLLGDMNCDTTLDMQDIPAFVLSLLNPSEYASTYPTCNIAVGDMNHDGSINGADIAGFVSALISS